MVPMQTVRRVTEYLQQNLWVVKLDGPRYICSGSLPRAVPQPARTDSTFAKPSPALAGTEHLFGPRGTLADVPDFDEEGGAYAHAA